MCTCQMSTDVSQMLWQGTNKIKVDKSFKVLVRKIETQCEMEPALMYSRPPAQ